MESRPTYEEKSSYILDIFFAILVDKMSPHGRSSAGTSEPPNNHTEPPAKQRKFSPPPAKTQQQYDPPSLPSEVEELPIYLCPIFLLSEAKFACVLQITPCVNEDDGPIVTGVWRAVQQPAEAPGCNEKFIPPKYEAGVADIPMVEGEGTVERARGKSRRFTDAEGHPGWCWTYQYWFFEVRFAIVDVRDNGGGRRFKWLLLSNNYGEDAVEEALKNAPVCGAVLIKSLFAQQAYDAEGREVFAS